MSTRGLLVFLIVAATALFAAGVATERAGGDVPREAAELGEAEGHAEEEGEASEGEEGHVEEGGAEAEEGKLLGVDLESTPVVILAVVASLGLAVAVWIAFGSTAVLGLTAAAMGVFAAIDVRELIHQLAESGGLLVYMAGLVALLHAAAALVALRAAIGRTPA